MERGFHRYVTDLDEGNAAIFSFSAKKSGQSPGLLLKDDVSLPDITLHL